MNSNGRSVFVKFAIGVVCLYSIYTFSFYIYDINSGIKAYKEQRTAQLILYSRLGQRLLSNNLSSELMEQLKDGQSLQQIDLYELKQNGKTLFTQGSDYVPESVKLGLPPNALSQFDDTILVRIQSGPYDLFLGVGFGSAQRFERVFHENRSAVLQDIGFVLILLAGLTIYAFKDIFLIFRSIRNRDRSSLQNMGANSIEAETLSRALVGYDSQLSQTKEQNLLLQQQLLPALRNELEQGHTIPYDFSCTLLRTDINNFSKIFLSQEREFFLENISAFFWECTHIIGRYGGWVQSFAGDEIIYYFKDSSTVKSVAPAVAAVRDIHRLAEKYDEKLRRERGYGFVVKSAFGTGSLRFGKLVDGYALAGTPFIESVRILSSIQEKEKNILVCGAAAAKYAEFAFTFKDEGSFLLKGYDGTTHLVSLVDQVPLEQAIKEAQAGDTSLLSLYRSDNDLIKILESLCQTWTQDAFLSVARLFRTYDCTNVGPGLVEAYTRFLCHQLKSNDPFRVSAALPLAVNFVPVNNLASELEGLFLRALQFSDNRISANAIELFTHYCPEKEVVALRALLKSEDNRVAANALIKTACQNLDEKTVSAIHKGLVHESPFFVASTLFAVGEIARFYQKRDPVFLHTRIDFARISQKLPEFVQSSNAMISRQALAAAKKLGDKKLENALYRIFTQTEDKELLKRFAQILSWEKNILGKKVA